MMNSREENYSTNLPPDSINFDQQKYEMKNDNKNGNKVHEHYVWEIRSPNTTVLNSPDLTEMNYSTHHQHQQIRLGRSPVNMHDENQFNSPGSPTDLGSAGINLVQEGEIVVFDDIDTNWIMKSDKINLQNSQNDDVLKVTKMIGQLPIAEYEGSPRRIGNHQSASQNHTFGRTSGISPTIFPRPPGFPQRISPSVTQEFVSTKPVDSNLIDIDGKLTESRNSDESSNNKPKTPTFDYLYEFSETRKVLEEFFKGTNEIEKKFSDFNESDASIEQDFNNIEEKKAEHAYIGQRLARIPNDELMIHKSPKKTLCNNYVENNDVEFYSNSRSSGCNEYIDTELEANLRRHSRNFTLSPETTDYDSNCGDLDSLSNDINCQTDFGKLYTCMPVLEDGLSSGHASDTENNFSAVVIEKNYLELAPVENMDKNLSRLNRNDEINSIIQTSVGSTTIPVTTASTANNIFELTNSSNNNDNLSNNLNSKQLLKESNFDLFYQTNLVQSTSPPPPAPSSIAIDTCDEIQEAIKDIRSALQRTKALQEKSLSTKFCDEVVQGGHDSPVWIPRCSSSNENESNVIKKERNDDEEPDTDLETDRLLGQQRLDDHGFYDENSWKTHLARLNSPNNESNSNVNILNKSKQITSSATLRHGVGTELTSSDTCKIIGSSDVTLTSPEKLQYTKTSPSGSMKSKKDSANGDKKSKSRNKEGLLDPAVLIEGVLFRARYLGSTQLVCEGQPTKSTRMMQAEEAVSRIKAPDGESQPSTEVDLFISTEKIMVLNTDLKEIMMDHALRTISYIADIGDLVVLMARRRFIPPESTSDDNVKPNRTPKMICHVFESEEAQFIAQSIGQAFQVAYMEFLKANGIEDHSFVKEMDYQEVLNSQEIFGDELEIFAKKELQKEVVVPKAKGEILGVVIVESGWGSMLPTVVIANLMSTGAAARCGQLNIGDQLIAINGLSLVGLPLSTCQTYIRNAKNQTAVKFTVVPCPPVVEVKIKRPNTKYQLGFSVQNGVICSLLRGGIAERGGVRVGHRIIEINNQSVVAVPHEKIVNLLATSVGEILMKTMPTSMFRLLTGQENPIYI